MSFLRIAVPGQPLRFVDQGPSSALVRHGGHAVPAENVGHMKVILTPGGNFVENRTRTKPNNPFSIHIENRR